MKKYIIAFIFLMVSFSAGIITGYKLHKPVKPEIRIVEKETIREIKTDNIKIETLSDNEIKMHLYHYMHDTPMLDCKFDNDKILLNAGLYNREWQRIEKIEIKKPADFSAGKKGIYAALLFSAGFLCCFLLH